MSNLFYSAPVVGSVIGVLLIAFVLVTGSTFGQRCDRAFPGDAMRAEQCVYDLSHDQRP